MRFTRGLDLEAVFSTEDFQCEDTCCLHSKAPYMYLLAFSLQYVPQPQVYKISSWWCLHSGFGIIYSPNARKGHAQLGSCQVELIFKIEGATLTRALEYTRGSGFGSDIVSQRMLAVPTRATAILVPWSPLPSGIFNKPPR